MRRRVGTCFLLACTSCQLFLSFDQTHDGDAGTPSSQEGGASSGEAGSDGGADSSTPEAGSDAGLPADAAAAADGACVLPMGTTGVCPAPGTVTSCQGVSWKGHCYFTISSTTVMFNYASARQACQNAGASLATITCEDEWMQASALTGGTYFFVDGRVGTKCTWTDDEPWTYAPWGDGNPIAGYGCVKVNGGSWYSAPCDSDNVPRALCEKQ